MAVEGVGMMGLFEWALPRRVQLRGGNGCFEVSRRGSLRLVLVDGRQVSFSDEDTKQLLEAAEASEGCCGDGMRIVLSAKFGDEIEDMTVEITDEGQKQLRKLLAP